jgi:hypothetical protein
MPPPDDDDADADATERRARDVVAASDELDAETKADLARWFGLPSFEQLQEQEAATRASATPRQLPEDDELRARIEAQARATAAIDPGLVDALHRQGANVQRLLRLQPPPAPTLDPTISALDPVLLARADAVTEPRELEMAQWVAGAMNECTPQAVLRDLHRPETVFQLYLEVDPAIPSLAAPWEVFAEVRATVAARLVPPLPPLPFRTAMAAYQVVVEAKRLRWSEIKTPNRQVSE